MAALGRETYDFSQVIQEMMDLLEIEEQEDEQEME